MRIAIALIVPIALLDTSISFAAEKDKKAREIAKFVGQLGDKEFRVREEASRQLITYGEAALDDLVKAKQSADPEVSARAREVIRTIEKKMTWELRQFKGHKGQILSVAFDSIGERCASAGFDKTIRIWNVENGKQLMHLDGHKDLVFSVAFSPNGRYLLSGSGGDYVDGKWSEGQDHTIRLWDLTTGKEMRRFGTPKDWVLCVAFSPDGKHVVSSTRNKDPIVRIWSVETGTELKQFKGHTSGVRSVAFSADGKSLVTSSYDQTVRLWDVFSGTSWALLRGHGQWVDRAVFAPDGKTVLSASRDNTFRHWNVEQNSAQRFSEKDQPIRTFASHTDHVLNVAFTPDGHRAVSSSGDRTVRVWDLKDGTELKRFDGHTGAIDALAVSPDGKFALSGSHDHTVRLWKLPR